MFTLNDNVCDDCKNRRQNSNGITMKSTNDKHVIKQGTSNPTVSKQ